MRFVSTTRSQVSSFGSSTSVHPTIAGAVDEHVEPVELREHLSDAGHVGDVARQREPATLGRKIGVHLGRLLEVVHMDERALGGEADCERAADSASLRP